MRSAHPFLLALVLLLLSSSPSSAATIPYLTFGPGVVNPAGIAALNFSYPTGYVPRNSSYPTLPFALTTSMDATLPLDPLVAALQFWVDAVNYRGGVSYLGQPHYVSVTCANDDDSDVFAAFIYQDMFASNLSSLYLAPYSDSVLQAVTPLLPVYQPTMMATANLDPADYAAHYPNLFAQVNTADTRYDSPLSQVNLLAQQYHAQTGLGSPHGISTLCLFTANESLMVAAAGGVRQWVAAENLRRGGVDEVRILVDVRWSNAETGAYDDYVPFLLNCPDDADVMIMQADSTSGLQVAEALAASQRRPKAALGLEVGAQYTFQSALSCCVLHLSTAEQAAALVGWWITISVSLSESTLVAKGGTFSDVLDAATAQYIWKQGAGLSNLLDNDGKGLLYFSALGILTAAVTRTASLSAADMRGALLSLKGEQALLTGIDFDNVTGVNVAKSSSINAQVTRAGIVNATAFSHIEYPFDWPWHPLKYGDVVSTYINPTIVVGAIVVAVLGAWVASIVVEQAVYAARKGHRWWLWLMVVAVSLGGVGIWCTQLLTASSLTVTADGATLDMRFSVAAILSGLPPTLVLTYAGLVALIGDVEVKPSKLQRNDGAAHQQRQTLREAKEAAKRVASLSHREHFHHLLRSISRRVVAGSVLIAAAIQFTRVSLDAMFVTQAQAEVAPWVWVSTVLLDILLVFLACLIFFHALRWRVVGVFVFAFAVWNDWLMHQNGVIWRYQPYGYGLPSHADGAHHQRAGGAGHGSRRRRRHLPGLHRPAVQTPPTVPHQPHHTRRLPRVQQH